jgi:hypothetical protein
MQHRGAERLKLEGTGPSITACRRLLAALVSSHWLCPVLALQDTPVKLAIVMKVMGRTGSRGQVGREKLMMAVRHSKVAARRRIACFTLPTQQAAHFSHRASKLDTPGVVAPLPFVAAVLSPVAMLAVASSH